MSIFSRGSKTYTDVGQVGGKGGKGGGKSGMPGRPVGEDCVIIAPAARIFSPDLGGDCVILVPADADSADSEIESLLAEAEADVIVAFDEAAAEWASLIS